MQEVYSHPGIPLIQHLKGVASGLKRIDMPYGEIVGLTHDIAKAHPIFQEKLRGRGGGRFSHALPSALLTYDMLISSGVSPYDALLFAEVVRLHHIGLSDYNSIENFWLDDDILNKYLEVLSEPQVLDFIKQNIWNDFNISKLEENLKSISPRFLMRLKRHLGDYEGLYFNLRSYLSMLVYADRYDALMHGEDFELPELTSDTARRALDSIDGFLHGVSPSTINHWRSRVRSSVLSSFIPQKGVVSLNLPTGAGKTLISLTMALKGVVEKGFKRIIYVLPFISIGEQTYSVFKEVLGEEFVKRVMLDNYLRGSRVDEEHLEKYDVAQVVMRMWNEPVVITTAVYMWRVLFGSSAMATMNYHLLKDSVIIFDEVQSIPTEYWGDLAKYTEVLSKDNMVILMSATQPISVNVADVQEYQNPEPIPIPRYTLNVKESVSAEDIVKEIKYAHKTNDVVSILVVKNTRKLAREFYIELKTLMEKEDLPTDYLFFLSTYVLPVHRRGRIEKIKERENKGLPRILISTQVVEAGVDLSFAKLYRDFAPWDSIIQSAGRCGRHGEVNGNVYINLDVGDTISRVYKTIKKEVSYQVLDEWREKFPLSEAHTSDIVNRYFTLLKNRKNTTTIMHLIQDGTYDVFPHDNLISGYIGETLYLAVDEQFYELISKLRKALSHGGDKFDKRNIVKILHSKLSQYAINVPKYIYDEIPSSHLETEGGSGSIVFIPREYVDMYYSEDVGFIPGGSIEDFSIL